MREENDMRSIFKKLVFAMLVLLSGASSAFALQPWQNGIANYFQQQNSAICGQTSMYMIARYYGHVGKDHVGDYPYKTLNLLGYWVSVDLDSYADVNKYWLFYVAGGMPITRVGTAIGALEMVDGIKKNNIKFYNNRYYAKNPNGLGYASGQKTTYDKTATNDNMYELAARLDYIKANYLDLGIPAVIHLDRVSGTGHYVILAGYDPASGTIYYVNPNWGACHTTGDKLESVDVSSFILDEWYVCGDDPAFWDGKWFVFYH